jgi:hypothetical protein
MRAGSSHSSLQSARARTALARAPSAPRANAARDRENALDSRSERRRVLEDSAESRPRRRAKRLAGIALGGERSTLARNSRRRSKVPKRAHGASAARAASKAASRSRSPERGQRPRHSFDPSAWTSNVSADAAL